MKWPHHLLETISGKKISDPSNSSIPIIWPVHVPITDFHVHRVDDDTKKRSHFTFADNLLLEWPWNSVFVRFKSCETYQFIKKVVKAVHRIRESPVIWCGARSDWCLTAAARTSADVVDRNLCVNLLAKNESRRKRFFNYFGADTIRFFACNK